MSKNSLRNLSNERIFKYDEKYKQAYRFLNEDQKRIVDTIEGPVMVVAGPGAGKTQVMSLRTANILRQTDVVADSILCLTFTDSATKNLQKRLHRYIGNVAYDVSVFTFHGFASHLKDEFGEFFYSDRDIQVVEELDQVLLLEKIMESLDVEADLRKVVPGMGYLYMGDVRQKISQLKRAGYSCEEFLNQVWQSKEEIENMQDKIGPFVDGLGRVSKKSIDKIVEFFESVKGDSVSSGSNGLAYTETWTEGFVREFAEMIIAMQEDESTKPFTEWKKKFLTKNAEKQSVLKDYTRLKKNIELAQVYERYCVEMDLAGWVDFDDLLMGLREKMKNDPAFLASVQERYLYVMVDEFQDTSGVQMDIVNMLLSSELGNENPNIMVVGDDDQSIYKFQGAKVSNILKFKQVYPASELIVLDKNYRSTQRILDVIRGFIVQGEDRLENHIEVLNKELIAGNSSLENGKIEYQEFAYELQELEWVASELKKRHENGENISEVAVIARNHATLRELSKMLNETGVPFSYEHSKDILQSEIVKKIHKILEFVDLEYDKNSYGADDMLVDILCFDFWQLPRLEVWKLIRKSYDERIKIGELIQNGEGIDEGVKKVVEFLFVLGQKAQEASVFEVLDFLLGGDLKVLDERFDDWVCPMKEFYFRRDENLVSGDYIEFLMDLKTLFDRLKDYRAGRTLMTKDVVDYLDSHVDHGLKINNNFNLKSSSESVSLLTAHKSKGMEFEKVYVVSCNDDKWASRGRVDKLQLINNVPVQTEPDESDDFLRLFYVALSRAKTDLIMSNFKMKSNGRETKPFRFMDTVLEDKADLFDEIKLENENQNEISERAVELDLGILLGVEYAEKVELENEEEFNFLKSLVEDFKLSVTAFNNFLNLEKGGPKYFLENNLLRFPKAKNAKAEYGSAMHDAISKFILLSKSEGSFVGFEKLIDLYKESVKRARMTEQEKVDFLELGIRHLERFYENMIVAGKIDLDDLTELSFGKENVVLDVVEEEVSVLLNGAIDWVHFVKDEENEIAGIQVVDFKTGKELKSWDKNYNEFEKFKAWQYRNQLGFYDFLLMGHRRLSKYNHLDSGLFFLESSSENPLLAAKLSMEELSRLKRLIGIVYKKIINLDFPDVSQYEANFMGTMDFVNDLLEGRI